MDVQAYRQNLIQQLSQVTSEEILKAIGEQLNKLTRLEQNADWWNELSKEEKAALELGLEQADKGDTISHDEMRTKINAILGE